MILLNDINDEKDAALVAQKVIDLIEKPFMLGEHQANIGTSIGISIYPADGADKAALLKCADAAMYLAKGNGRNNFQFCMQHQRTAQTFLRVVEPQQCAN